jgi:2-polyprenyl-3-methyl-5-hydroxy-6-metoxy-1,4-benzoquinol methylase
MLSHSEEQVARYYDEQIYEAEIARLPREFPVEMRITKRFLAKWIQPGMAVAETGVGGGEYSEWLVRRGCRVHLIDVSRRLLETAAAKAAGGGLLGATQASAASLSAFESESFDAMLLLGPLYHLLTAADRERAVAEAARVLRPGGLLFAAGINRLCYLRELFRSAPNEVLNRAEFHERHLLDGNLDPEHAPPIGYAHLTGIEEFRALFRGRFVEEELAGVESFTGPWQASLNNLAPEVAEAWLDLVEQTARTPEALGHSDHYLFISP